MIRWLCILVVATTVVAVGSVAAGDEPPDAGQLSQPDDNGEQASNPGQGYFDTEHRIEIYEQSRLEPWRAVGYTAVFPGLGNFYAEQYVAGTVALSAMVFAGMFVGFGAMNSRPDLVRIGAVIAGLSYLGAGTAGYLGARAHNAQLRRSLHIDEQFDASADPSPHPGITLTWRF